jgi:nicotinamidase-related amidase
MAGEWKSAIPPEVWQVYEQGGFGHQAGYGVRPALLIIDVQYQTVGLKPMSILESISSGYPLSCGEAGWRSIKAIATLLAAARGQHVPVIYPHNAPKIALDRGQDAAKIPSLMTVPDRGYEFVDEIKPVGEDLLLPKQHASAFFGTSLASYLVKQKIDTLLLTGNTTSGCVRATAVDGASYNFHCVVIEDCVYDRSIVSHNVNLFDLQAKYADVVSLDEALSYLSGVEPGVEAAG